MDDWSSDSSSSTASPNMGSMGSTKAEMGAGRRLKLPVVVNGVTWTHKRECGCVSAREAGGGGRLMLKQIKQHAKPAYQRGRRGGGFGTCEIWNGKIWCGEILAPIVKYYCKMRYKRQIVPQEVQAVNGGCYFLEAFEGYGP